MKRLSKLLSLFLVVLIILSVFQVLNLPYKVKAQESNIGYELLDDNKVLCIWNKQDSYYFNVSSGVQFSNHYEEYWSHNVLMLGYYANEKWNLVYRVDELSGFERTVETDNISYVNVTLWKKLSHLGYNFRLALRYHLKVDDARLTVQPYIQNLGVPIDLDIGFAWRIKNIQIANNVENDKLFVNGTSYFLNQTVDVTYRNMTTPIYDENEILIGYEPTPHYYVVDQKDRVSRELYLGWNENLTYLVQVKSVSEQYNAPVTLAVKVGSLASGQEKSTLFYWHDADWTTPDAVHSCDGEDAGHEATKAIDDDIGTYWTHEASAYHWIVFDMGETKTITKIRLYQATLADDRWGRSKGLEVYVTDDPDIGNWGDPVWEGVLDAEGWQNSGAFEKDGRYVVTRNEVYTWRQRILEFDAYAEAAAPEDETPPTYSNVGTNTTLAGQPCLFHVKCTDETSLASTGGYIFGTNNSGTPTNDTWIAFSFNPDWANITKTLTDAHKRVEWWVYFNDTSNNWNNTGIQFIFTIGSFSYEFSETPSLTSSATTSKEKITVISQTIVAASSSLFNYETHFTLSQTITSSEIIVYSKELMFTQTTQSTVSDSITKMIEKTLTFTSSFSVTDGLAQLKELIFTAMATFTVQSQPDKQIEKTVSFQQYATVTTTKNVMKEMIKESYGTSQLVADSDVYKETQVYFTSQTTSTSEVDSGKELFFGNTEDVSFLSEEAQGIEKSIIIAASTTVTTVKVIIKEKAITFIEKHELTTMDDSLTQRKELLLALTGTPGFSEQKESYKEKYLELSATENSTETTSYQKELMFSQQEHSTVEWFRTVSKELSVVFIEFYEPIHPTSHVITILRAPPVISVSVYGFALIAFTIAICALALVLFQRRSPESPE